MPDSLARKNQTRGNKGRVVPDISMVGDPNTGMLVGQTQTFPEGVSYDEYRIGGTSLSSPLFAGVMALADDVLGVHHGFINPTIYQKLAGTRAITDVKHVKGGVVARRLPQRRRRRRRHRHLDPHLRLRRSGHQDHGPATTT